MQTLSQPAGLMTIAELGEFLKVSVHTIYYWVERNEIPFLKIGRHLRFNAGAVLEHFNQQTKDNKPACREEPLLVKKNVNHGSFSNFQRSLKSRNKGLAETERE